MTNNKPWQTIVNANDLPKTLVTENPLSAVKKETPSKVSGAYYTSKSLPKKRYSFDDNGGGYEGL